MFRALIFGLLLAVAVNGNAWAQAEKTAPVPAKRHFEFVYSGVITDLPKDATVRAWIPLPPSNQEQRVVRKVTEIPGKARETQETVHGNRMLFVEFQAKSANELPFRLEYDVTRNELNSLASKGGERLTSEQKRIYSAPNRLVPIDGKPASLLDGSELPKDPIESGRFLYDLVENYMSYDKSNPGFGQGDVLWACDSKTGNCTDFHSLFISLARNQQIPAFFEIGFPLPVERGQGKVGGYHCWAKYYAKDHGWVPVDISEADKHPDLREYYFGNLSENRMAFSKGRDIDLEPKQSGESLNYFVFPHVEVDGKLWPRAKIKMEFQYRDID